MLGLISDLRKVSGREIRRAADLQRVLGVHKKLAWQVHRFATASDPLAEAGQLPTFAALDRLMQDARRTGTDETSIDRVRHAVDRLEEVIRVHAGSRGAFDSMIGALSEDGSGPITRQHRRAAYHANSHILGVQARSQFSCFAIKPSGDDPHYMDTFSIRGLLDLRRLSSNASWMISTTRLIDDEGKIMGGGEKELLDSVDPQDNPAGLIRRFCSTPLPSFCTVATRDGHMNVELSGSTVGNLSAVTCVNGYIWRRALPRYRDEKNHHGAYSCKVRNPLEVAILDLFIHESAYDPPLIPQALQFSDHRSTDQQSRERGLDLLSRNESAVYLGRGAEAVHTPDVPDYVEIVHHAFERAGWNPEEFDLYRCRVEYPFMPSSLLLRYELPEEPGGPA